MLLIIIGSKDFVIVASSPVVDTVSGLLVLCYWKTSGLGASISPPLDRVTMIEALLHEAIYLMKSVQPWM